MKNAALKYEIGDIEINRLGYGTCNLPAKVSLEKWQVDPPNQPGLKPHVPKSKEK
ncbi:MAG: hypothetical protein JWR09_3789 [Mucilaginibacter sp.]|nr:hypothetical protein [Mucilaginibacter sp.]